MPSDNNLRLPEWIKVKLPRDKRFGRTSGHIHGKGLHTVCKNARCPNIFECFSKGTGTFLIMGTQCTRNCRFCNITSGKPESLDPEEPMKVVEAVKDLGLNHVVITSVTRDDLPDGGAGHFARVIERIRQNIAGVSIEVLIPDFNGSRSALSIVLEAGPEIINHNMETVSRLYPEIRPEAVYERSLQLLKRVSENPGITAKSGIMVGLGERDEEIEQVLHDLHGVGCEIVTIGQYLRPSRNHFPVQRYVPPEQFDRYEQMGKTIGIPSMYCGPLVRSSYNASRFLPGR